MLMKGVSLQLSLECLRFQCFNVLCILSTSSGTITVLHFLPGVHVWESGVSCVALTGGTGLQ